MVGVVSSIPSGGNFIFADFETLDVNFVQNCQKCQICVILEKLEYGIVWERTMETSRYRRETIFSQLDMF